MKMLSKEQYKELVPYEIHFTTAKNGYARGLYSDGVTIIENVYNALGYHLESRSCPACILEMLRIVGELFFKYKNRYYKNEGSKTE